MPRSTRTCNQLFSFLSAAFTVIASSSDMSAECQKFAIEFLCFYTFPLCDRHHINPTPRKVCRDECEALEGNICEKEYTIGRHHPMIGKSIFCVTSTIFLKYGTYISYVHSLPLLH